MSEEVITPETVETKVTFCPICGDTMHQETRYERLWWVCDDPDCGFFELV